MRGVNFRGWEVFSFSEMENEMKLGVVGSRKKITLEKVFLVLDDFALRNKIDRIISGGAMGVDTFAVEWAERHNVKWDIFKPDWQKFGKAAGAIRNQIIVDASDELLIFWNGESPGTKITMQMAKKANKPFNLVFSGSNPKSIVDALK